MKDSLGREIDYLRISVTNNCNLKCLYCSPGSNIIHHDELTPEDFEIIVRNMAELGIKRVRLTGGEPLIREDICEIIQRISNIEDIEDISMTTNGIYLDGMAYKLKLAGLHRINISLDSLKADRFLRITGGGKIENVLKGIEAAVNAGLDPVKINTVLMKGINDDEIDDFMLLAKEQSLAVRFIELMPIGRYGEKNTDKIVYNTDIINSRPQLIFCEDILEGQPASYYRVTGYKGKIGFISPISHRFCGSCNRIRLTSDGKLKPCLGNNGEIDITQVLRSNPDELKAVIHKAIYDKPQGHSFGNGFSSVRNMSMIGG
jgi:cyclic pyranopterin phosphate synthase